MRLIEIGQVWTSNAYNQYVWLVIKIENGRIITSRIDLEQNIKTNSILAYCSTGLDGLTYTSELPNWILIKDGPILDQIKRMEWADKYL